MRDTTPVIVKKMREMIQMKLPIERLKMGCSMYETSKYLIIQAILKNNPQISKADFQKELFLFYGDNFNLVQQERIIKHLEHIFQQHER